MMTVPKKGTIYSISQALALGRALLVLFCDHVVCLIVVRLVAEIIDLVPFVFVMSC